MQSQLGITPPAELDSKLFDMAEEKINSDENHTEAPTEKKSPALEINNPYFDSGAATPLKKRLPAFLDHFNYKDLKTLFKCSLAVWIMTLFTLINPVLSVEGQAAFFGWSASLPKRFEALNRLTCLASSYSLRHPPALSSYMPWLA